MATGASQPLLALQALVPRACRRSATVGGQQRYFHIRQWRAAVRREDRPDVRRARRRGTRPTGGASQSSTPHGRAPAFPRKRASNRVASDARPGRPGRAPPRASDTPALPGGMRASARVLSTRPSLVPSGRGSTRLRDARSSRPFRQSPERLPAATTWKRDGSLLPCIPPRAGVGRENRCSVGRSIRLNTYSTSGPAGDVEG